MGIFNMFKKKENEPIAPTAPIAKEVAPSVSNGINFTKQESINQLNLRKETFEICLVKKNLTNIVARVAVVMDKSGSMKRLYNNGTVQKVVERLLPIALRFDDNKELDMWIFHDEFERVESVREHDFFDYVDREIVKKHQYWGSTNYDPVMKDILKKYVDEEPSNIPTFVIYLTDGQNYDKKEAEKVIIEASQYNIFWQFVGIGNENFDFLQKLDDIGGRVVDNADFFQIQDINKVSDEELYNKLMTEYPGWETKARSLNVIR